MLGTHTDVVERDVVGELTGVETHDAEFSAVALSTDVVGGDVVGGAVRPLDSSRSGGKDG